ncbi:hypothetical protein AB4K01_16240 [Serratia fonticola]|uniref:hypothetical protein n=1 Tax=Serratia fonticola TaxID=47917 RepID=UPI0034C64BEC
MINQDVFDKIAWLLSLFKTYQLTFITSAFAIYFAIMKLTNKIGISYAITNDIVYGQSVSNIVIFNKRDKVCLIDEITLTHNNITFILKKFDIPLMIKPYESTSIEPDLVSRWHDEQGNKVDFSIDILGDLFFKVKLCGGKAVDCEIIGRVHSIDSSYMRKSTVNINGVILSDRMKHILTIIKNGTANNVIFLNHGFIENSAPLGGFNFIPPHDNNTSGIKEMILNHKLHQKWDNYYLYEIDQNLRSKETLRKYDVMKEIGEII